MKAKTSTLGKINIRFGAAVRDAAFGEIMVMAATDLLRHEKNYARGQWRKCIILEASCQTAYRIFAILSTPCHGEINVARQDIYNRNVNRNLCSYDPIGGYKISAAPIAEIMWHAKERLTAANTSWRPFCRAPGYALKASPWR